MLTRTNWFLIVLGVGHLLVLALAWGAFVALCVWAASHLLWQLTLVALGLALLCSWQIELKVGPWHRRWVTRCRCEARMGVIVGRCGDGRVLAEWQSEDGRTMRQHVEETSKVRCAHCVRVRLAGLHFVRTRHGSDVPPGNPPGAPGGEDRAAREADAYDDADEGE